MRAHGLIGVVLLPMAGFLLAGCDVSVDIDVDDGVRGSGTVISESREVSGFNEVVLLGSGDVIVSVTGTESLIIEAEDNIMPLLTAEVRSGRLELGSDSSFSATKGITYTVSAAAFDGVTINGSGNVEVSGVDANSFEAIINGSGDVEPAGTTVELTVGINGSGNFNGENLIAPRGSVEVAGSGSVVVNVTDDLMVRIAGSGDVEYLGNPTLIQEIAGSGNISQR